MSRTLFLDAPENFDFRQTVTSHGWSQLAPFELEQKNWILKTVLDSHEPFAVQIGEIGGRLAATVSNKSLTARKAARIVRDVRHILRLDDDLEDFYRQTQAETSLAWIAGRRAGRLLRSPTVYEDAVKTLCTTNCSWALTKIMVRNLVEKLGKTTRQGEKAFPTPQAMAEKSEEFYRAEIRAGYRAAYFVELARRVAEGKLNVENWLNADLPTAELKKEIKKINGFGEYAAENLLKLVGRYDGLALDSMLRGRFYKKHNNGSVCDDRQIALHYERFGNWRGLAIWCDMTEKS